MKRLILIFCADGNAGKAFAETLRNDETTTQLRDAGGVDLHFQIEHCDNVVIMPDVSPWKRRVLEKVYDGFVLETQPAPSDHEQQGTGYDPGAVGYELQGRARLGVKHKGFGRWFVMAGETEVSGPHTKDEAERLAA